jgi:hypothetical protein
VIEVTVCKADKLLDREEIPEVEGAVIHITEKMPEHTNLEDAEWFHDKQAHQIADALFKSLPQGTCDRILIHLMERKLSLYRGVTIS